MGVMHKMGSNIMRIVNRVYDSCKGPRRRFARSQFHLLAALLLLVFVAASEPALSETAGDQVAAPVLVRIPVRSENAMTGSAFAHATEKLTGPERQKAALAEIERGNIPEFLRTLKLVRMDGRTASEKESSVIIWVMPDYLAIGSNEDFLRIPLTMPSATAVANEFGFSLPTRKMVDAIYAQADHRFRPIPMKPGLLMRSSDYYLRHQQMIEKQRVGRSLGELVAGHKKDIVLTTRLRDNLGRIAIYGWQQPDGKPIQPLSTVHDQRYADYSHGVRLVWGTVWIDGEPRSLYDTLKDPELAPLLTYESLFKIPRVLMRLIKEPIK